MKNLLIDLKEFLKYIFTDNSKICFFNENNNSFEYIKLHLEKKLKQKKVLLITFEKIIYKNNNLNILFLKTNFFRELFFLTSKKKYIYSTTPDLNNCIFKKTIFFNTKYIYLQHSSISLVRGYQKDAFKNFDAIQAINKFQHNEIKFFKKKYKNKIKSFKSKYNFIENIKKYNVNINLNSHFDIIIAPTWGTDFFKNCFKKILEKLHKEKLKLIYRPHIMTLKKNEIDVNLLNSKNIKIDLDTNLNFNNFDYLISDYSGIIFEYFLIKKKSPILINNIKKKELNHDIYTDQTIEETFREIVETKYSVEQFMTQDINSILRKTNNIYNLEEFFNKNFY